MNKGMSKKNKYDKLAELRKVLALCAPLDDLLPDTRHYLRQSFLGATREIERMGYMPTDLNFDSHSTKFRKRQLKGDKIAKESL